MNYAPNNTRQATVFEVSIQPSNEVRSYNKINNLILIIVMIFGFQIATAQQFDVTKDYYVSFQGQLNEEGTVLQSGLLMTNEDTPKEITSFPIADTEMIHDITISKLENPGLHGVKSVLKVAVQYVEYCSYNVDNYILETEKGGYIILPMLTNEDCGDSSSKIVYLFPNQGFGEENKILTSTLTIASNAIVDAAQEDSFIWNDDNYGTSGRLYEDF